MVAQVLRHGLAGVEALLDLRVGDIAGDDEGAGEGEPGLDRVLAQLGADLVHRQGEVDLHHVVRLTVAEVVVVDLGEEVGRLELELLDEHSFGGDLAEALPVRRAGDRDGHRQAGPVPGEPDDPDVVTEVLPAELGADAELLGQLEDLGLEVEVTEGVRAHRALGRERVEVLGRGVLRGLEGELRARPADDDGEVVGRAGRGAERAELLVEEAQHRGLVEDGLGLLVEVALVGAAAALGQ